MGPLLGRMCFKTSRLSLLASQNPSHFLHYGSFLPSIFRPGRKGHNGRKNERVSSFSTFSSVDHSHRTTQWSSSHLSSPVAQTGHPWSLATITLSARTSLIQGSRDSLPAPSLLPPPPLLYPLPSSYWNSLPYDSVLSPARLRVIDCPSELIPSG